MTITVIILRGVSMWNEYAFSLYILQKPKMYTLTLAIGQFFSGDGKELNMAAAAALICILPILLIYILLQKQFINGAMDSAVKG